MARFVKLTAWEDGSEFFVNPEFVVNFETVSIDCEGGPVTRVNTGGFFELIHAEAVEDPKNAQVPPFSVLVVGTCEQIHAKLTGFDA
tara:strand:+ start:159 stop:419 length:261 start_codon:yes stop_codon:yes gene_type:complete